MAKINKEQTLSILKKVLWAVVTAIFIFLVIVVAILAFDKFVNKAKVPSCFGYSVLTVETGSMQGTIDDGDLIIIKEKSEYKLGEIVTYIGEDDLIPTTHRIVNLNSDGTFVTKGDANNTTDQDWITQDMILGEVVLVVPKLGVFGDWVRAEGWLYILSALAIIILGSFIIKSSNGGKEPEKAEEAEKTEEAEQETQQNAEKDAQQDAQEQAQEKAEGSSKPQSQDSSNEPDNKQS